MSVSLARTTLRDSAGILVAGLALGLLANALSPRGISLRRDYFPAAAAPAGQPLAPNRPDDSRKTRLAQRGVSFLTHERAAEFFRDPGLAEGRIVFLDARDDAHYEAGHLPGAAQLDHYHLEKHLGPVLAACAVAERIVVYCNGGECEDSELAANDLLELGVPASKLFLYAGGIAAWRAHRLPLATGPRPHGPPPQP